MRRSVHAPWMLAALLAAAASGPVMAGALSVSPTRIELSARHPIATLEVRNEGEAPVTVQLERLAWTQRDGEDAYTASAALVATPSVFEIAPHGSQILRIARREGGAKSGERAYRLYASEVPAAQPFSGAGLQMALRIGVPVFVEPSESKWRLEGEIFTRADGRRALRLGNAGGHFTRALRVAVQDSAGAVLWQTDQPAYLLAGGEHHWLIDSPAAVLPSSDPLRLSVTTETGVEHIDARLSP